MKLTSFLWVIFLFLPTHLQAAENSGFAEKIKFPVIKYKLDNGMTVLLHQDRSVPTVSVHQWYRVGSRNERPGITGIAHFFEHLMFKGTKKYPPSKFDGLIQSNGGTNNAFTSYDYTGYYVDIVSGKLDLILDMEADRMTNLIFSNEMIQSEREVVKEERRFRLENSIRGSINEAMFASVFKVHNYRWPIIGSMKDLNGTSMDQLKAFYKTYYSPNNSVLVIAGDFDLEKIKKFINKYYAKIPAQKIPKEKIPEEPTQRGKRVVTLKKEVQSPTVAIAYKSVESGHKDQYAFDLLSNILTEGSSSRLYRKMVYKQQKLSSVSSWAYTPRDPGIFQIYAGLKPKVAIPGVIATIKNEIRKLQANLVKKQELEKAKNQVLKSYVDSLKTISGRARALAINEILFSDYQVLYKDIGKYLSVTRSDIQRVAKTYLGSEKMNVIKVIPKGSKK